MDRGGIGGRTDGRTNTQNVIILADRQTCWWWQTELITCLQQHRTTRSASRNLHIIIMHQAPPLPATQGMAEASRATMHHHGCPSLAWPTIITIAILVTDHPRRTHSWSASTHSTSLQMLRLQPVATPSSNIPYLISIDSCTTKHQEGSHSSQSMSTSAGSPANQL